MPSAWVISGTSDGVNWTVVDERSSIKDWTYNETRSFTIASPGNYSQYEINVTANNGGSNVCICELAFYEAGLVNALTLLSTSFTALSTPVAMKGLILASLGTAVLGTDFLVDYSRNAGGNWAAATFTDRFVIPGTTIHVIETNLVDLSGQPVAAAPKARIRELNGKSAPVHGHYFEWI